MGKSILIKDTTREEREQIIWQACSCGAGCEPCCACKFAGNPEIIYKEYLDGVKEIAQINMERNQRRQI